MVKHAVQETNGPDPSILTPNETLILYVAHSFGLTPAEVAKWPLSEISEMMEVVLERMEKEDGQ